MFLSVTVVPCKPCPRSDGGVAGASPREVWLRLKTSTQTPLSRAVVRLTFKCGVLGRPPFPLLQGTVVVVKESAGIQTRGPEYATVLLPDLRPSWPFFTPGADHDRESGGVPSGEIWGKETECPYPAHSGTHP